jgi:hypothetical protein
MKSETDHCPYCDHRVYFDNFDDIHRCQCGAQETTKGWQSRDIKAKKKTKQPLKQMTLFLLENET